MKKFCIHPLDGRARLLDVVDHKQIIIERCTKCMHPEWVLEGREGIDYPKTYSQETLYSEINNTIKLCRKEHDKVLDLLEKDILTLPTIEEGEYVGVCKDDIKLMFAKYRVKGGLND